MAWACEFPAPPPPSTGEVELTRGELTSPEALDRGRTLFAHQCAVCHGDGRGNGPRAARLASSPADLTASAWQRDLAPEDVYRIIRDGVPGTDMPSWKALRPEDLTALTAFVLALDGSPGEAGRSSNTSDRSNGGDGTGPAPEPVEEPAEEAAP